MCMPIRQQSGPLTVLSAGLLLICSLVFLAEAEATPRPQGAIISPAPWSVINSNGIRVRAEATDTVCGIDRVVFLAHYVDAATRTGQVDTIAIDSTYPYDAVWNVHSLPDQGWLDLKIYCDIYNEAQRRRRTPPTFLILDRNPSFSQKVIAVPFIAGTATQGELLGYFRKAESNAVITIRNDDNRYTLKAVYSRKELHFLIEVEDQHFFNRHADDSAYPLTWKRFEERTFNPIPRVWQDDCLLLLFDTRNRKQELPDQTTRMLFVLPNGRFYAIFAEPRHNRFTNWSDSVSISVDSSLGTKDVPLRRFLLSIPWSSLDRRPPNASSSLGFQFYLSDRDMREGKRVICAWSGEPHNQNNPSEWGSLVLVQPSWTRWLALSGGVVVLGLLISLAVAGSRMRSRGRSIRDRATHDQTAPALQQDASGVLCRQVVELIEKQFEDSALSRSTIAKQLHISTSYLSSAFNREMGVSLPAYINRYRLEQARFLLANPSNSVSTVALRVGYNSLDHFIRKFKEAYSVTPKQYQQKRRFAANDEHIA
ncbi:MAG: helix-turn-helix domain-containing protein [Chitinivibrionales bacterium]|nr:helix-turn-helix domain-containing protein [Chitinivibrionales bacterium]